MSSAYARHLGSRLRAIRTQQGLSLHGVEEKSRGHWKAVVVGSYERGDRSVTVERLNDLAAFYDVDPADVLPGGGAVTAWGAGRRKAATHAAARALLSAIPAAIEGLPAQEFDAIADAISAGVRERLENEVAAHYQRTITRLERELADLRAALPEVVSL